MNSLKIPKCATNQDSLLLKTLQIESEQIINFILMPDVCYTICTLFFSGPHMFDWMKDFRSVTNFVLFIFL